MLNKSHGNKGALLVESAITIPILILLVLGLIQYGLYLTTLITLRDAAAIAARTAILPLPASAPSNVELSAKSAVQPLLDQNKLTVVNIDPSYSINGFSATKVDLSYDFDVLFKGFIPSSPAGTITINVSSVMR